MIQATVMSRELHKITGKIRLGQKLPKCGLARRRCRFLFHQPGSENDAGRLSLSTKSGHHGGKRSIFLQCAVEFGSAPKMMSAGVPESMRIIRGNQWRMILLSNSDLFSKA